MFGSLVGRRVDVIAREASFCEGVQEGVALILGEITQ